MKKEGDIIVTDKEVDPNLELTGIQKTARRRLPDSVQQRQRQTAASLHHQPVRRHERHQQNVRLERSRRSHAKTRLRHHPSDSAHRRRSKGRAGAGRSLRETGGGQRLRRADSPHQHRARIDRRLGQPVDLRRIFQRRHRPRLQPHELSLGQCRNVPDFPRLAYVAGRQQVLQRQQDGADHHELRLAGGGLAARRRRFRLRDPAARLR